MTTLDWLMIAAYFSVLAGLTWWSISRSRQTADDYFLAGRNLGWWVIGASIFASNIGSEHIVEVLREVSGNRMAAAKVLGISRRALYRRLARHRITEIAAPRGNKTGVTLR